VFSINQSFICIIPMVHTMFSFTEMIISFFLPRTSHTVSYKMNILRPGQWLSYRSFCVWSHCPVNCPRVIILWERYGGKIVEHSRQHYTIVVLTTSAPSVTPFIFWRHGWFRRVLIASILSCTAGCLYCRICSSHSGDA